MSVPGINVLGLALRAIQAQPVSIYRFAVNVGQLNGADVPMYAAGVPAVGSVQPVSSEAKQQLGLDWDDTYVTIFTQAPVKTIGRDTAGDVVVYAGKYYHAQGVADWLGQDGWMAVLAVQIPPLTAGQILP